MSVVDDVATVLQTAGIGTIGTDLFRGPERPADGTHIPQDCVFVSPGSAGQPPEGVSGNLTAVQYAPVQVVVRNLDFSTGDALALLVHTTLGVATIASSIGHVVEQGHPNFLGVDEDRLYRWSINLTVTVAT